MILRVVSLLCFVLVMNISFAQNGTITGTVMNNDGEPLIGAVVVEKGTTNAAVTDEMGAFTLPSVMQGDNTLIVKYIGYKTRELPVYVKGATDLNNIVLYEGTELIQEVFVTGERDNKFARDETDYVSKLPLRDLENAVVYSTVTNELMESQVITNFDDAMVNATGITKLWESTGRDPGFGTAYFSTRGFSTQPALVDGMPGYTFSAIDPSYVERIEVIKGPNATLFGSTVTSLGGLINVVTKKPYNGFGGNVSYTAGSFNQHRISGDINTPIGKSEKLFLRTNASYLTQDSFQDAGFRKTFFVAPSLSYKASNRLSFSGGVEFSETEQTNPSMLFVRRGLPLVSKNPEELGIDLNKSFTNNDITLTSPVVNTRFAADYKLSDKWTSRTNFAGINSKVDGYYQYMIEGAGAVFAGVGQGISSQVQGFVDSQPFIPPQVQFVIDGLNNDINALIFEGAGLTQSDVFTRVYDYRDAKATKANIQQNFVGDFELGGMRNRMVIGLDYVNRNEKINNKFGNPTLTQNSTFPSIIGTLDVLAPGTGTGLNNSISSTFPYIDGFFKANGDVVPTSFTPNAQYTASKADLDAVFDGIEALQVETNSKTYAAYVSDVVNLTDELTVNVGLRLDHFDQKGDKKVAEDDYNKTTFSPTVGVVYQAIPKALTVFANYQTGFSNNDPAINQDGSVTTIEPTKARQFEGGLKASLLDGKLFGGISYYHITANDIRSSDPRAPIFPVALSLEELVSKGVEIELNTNPIDGLNVRASFSNNDTENTNTYSSTTGESYPELDGRRPVVAGPESLYNFWADYKFQEGSALNNFGLGAGFNGASEFFTQNNGVTGQFALPAYTLFNASVYYDAAKFRVGLKANNFTDKTYYTGWSTVNAQLPANYSGMIQYKF